MKLFESDIYATNSKDCNPFKIIIEKNNEDEKHKIEVKRIEYTFDDDKAYENESVVFADNWIEKKPEVLRMAADEALGSFLMFDFSDEFLNVMKNGGKTVLVMYDEETDKEFTETWYLTNDKYVCNEKGLSYILEELVNHMDEESCGGVDVFLNEKLKIQISLI